MIAGFVGFVSACYGKEVSGKKSNTRIMNMVMILSMSDERDRITAQEVGPKPKVKWIIMLYK